MRVRRHCGSNRSTIRKWALAKLILGAGSVLPIVNSNSNISVVQPALRKPCCRTLDKH